MRLAEGSFQALSAEILAQGHWIHCPTFGSSMFPLIRSRSHVQVQPVKLEQLRPGDVLLYRSGEMLIAHRLLRQEPGPGKMTLVTRGDAFPWSAIERHSPEQVLGRIVSVEWPQGFKLRIDRGPGRRLSLLLAKISPFLWLAYLTLGKIKRGLFSLFQAWLISLP